MPSTTARGDQSNLYAPPRFSFSHPRRNPHMTATVTHIAAARDAAPAHLGEHGRRLWRDIITDHGIDDACSSDLRRRDSCTFYRKRF